MSVKKAKKAARSIKPLGRNPVIAVRVPEPLHARIKAAADAGGQSMSETMAALIQNGLDWNAAFADRVTMLRQARQQLREMLANDLKAAMRAKGWVRRHGSPYWVDPEALAQRSGFIDPDHPDLDAPVDGPEWIAADLDVLEDRIRKLRSKGDN
jgi:hypothetical protein